MKVEFDELTHTYWVDGQICPSVTQLIAWKFPDKYAGIKREILDEASRKGTELHNAIEIYEKYGMERDDLIEFRNYKFLKERFGFKVIGNEEIVVITYKDMVVCGRTDLIIECDGVLGLADIKRTASCDKDYLAYQLNLYALGFGAKEIKKLVCIWLRDEKRKVVDIPLKPDLAIELLEEYYRFWKEKKDAK